jgi:asparagine synthase (glutamine-hydrolysing)
VCAIFGIIGIPKPENYDSRVLSHRGPDCYQEWTSIDVCNPAFFAHHRLSVIGKSYLNNQPMVSSDSRYILNFNGEIFNYKELREELIKDGLNFFSESDTEVFLKGLIKYGVEFQMKCNGMWAFALYDRYTNNCLLGRDRFGEKPLFYLTSCKVNQQFLAFSSEIKGLKFLMKEQTPHPYLDVILKYPFLVESSEETYYQSIKRLPAGCCGVYADGKFEVKRWWDTLSNLVETPENYDSQVSSFRGLLTNSVSIRSESQNSYALTCSGGLDSSSVLSLFSQCSGPSRGIAYNMSYSDPKLDESEWATSLCKSLNFPLKVVSVSTPSFDEVLKTIQFLEDPYVILGIPMMQLYRRMASDGHYVCLDGHGADELCGGYFDFLNCMGGLTFERFLEYYPIQLKLKGLNPRTRYDAFLFWMIQSSKAQLGQIASKTKVKFSALIDDQAVLFADFLKTPHYNNDPRYLSMDPVDRKFYDLFHHTILPTLLRNYDRYSMSAGVEVRSPFLDHRLVTFGFSIPASSKIGGGYTKRILRDSMAGIVPENILYRLDKVSWLSPTREWFLGPLKGNLIEYFGDTKNRYGTSLLKKLKFTNSTYPIILELWKSAYINRDY